MIEIEMLGNEAAIAAAKAEISPLTTAAVRGFRHQGASGEGGVYGLLTSVITSTIPKLVELAKNLIVKDRDLKISFNGFEISAKDIKEATEIIDLLVARGIIPKGSG